MDYRTVFDIAQVGYKSWDVPAQGLIFVAVGVVLIVFRRRLPRWGHTGSRFDSVFPFAFFGFGVVWTLFSFWSTYSEYTHAMQAIKAGRAGIVEGVVSDFKPMPATGHAMERFCVKDRCFEFSDFVITPGFNNASSHGGPIRKGLPVRVTFVGTCIVKLEVAK